MTAACREACCSVTPRFTVAELFERGFRRNRASPFAIEGETIKDAEDNSARFSVEFDGGRLAGIRFRVSSCTTLIAYSEALAELLSGLDAGLAAQFAPRELVGALPGVPVLKQNRAVLAVAAFRSALTRHPEVRVSERERASKDDVSVATLRGSATSSPHTSG